MRIQKTLIKSLIITAVIFAAVSGCATFKGPMEIQNQIPDISWISPKNNDGINDSLEITIDFLEYKNIKVASYSFIITDSAGKTVTTEGEEALKPSKSKIKLPESFSWHGTDSNGHFVADGEYKYHLKVVYAKDMVFESPAYRVIVDNTAPALKLSAAYPLFSPDGDDKLETVRIFQRNSSVEDKWNGSIVDASGKSVREFTWEGLAVDFDWDGKNSSNEIQADGAYAYKISSTDKAGNTSSYSLDGIVIDTKKNLISITADLESFSPNGDGKKDFLTLTMSAGNAAEIESWKVSIFSQLGQEIKVFSGEKIPQSIKFEGKEKDGRRLPDGYYKARLEVDYVNGDAPVEVSQLFEIDTVSPLAFLSADQFLFSPDGDGLKDTLVINQSTSPELFWNASIMDSTGHVVRTFGWQERAKQIEWDGKNDAGQTLPDGIYSYRVESTDKADNYSSKDLKGIRIDSRLPVSSVSVSEEGISPNSDGIYDVMSFNLSTSINEEIARWILEIKDSNGNTIRTFQSEEGDTAIPAKIDWNGKDISGGVTEGNFKGMLSIEYIKGNIVIAETPKPVTVDVTGPILSLKAEPVLFSPDGDGTDDILTIKTEASDISGIDSWKINVFDPAGNLFKSYSGKGTLSSAVKWDGYSDKKELVQSASDYVIEYSSKDMLGNIARVSTVTPIDILVIKDGNNLKIIISSIYFVPNQADYTNVEEDKAKKNLETLDQLANVLKKYSSYKIRVEGHAVRVYWDNPAKFQSEQDDVLLPLSAERAEVIKAALAARGIDEKRMTTYGFGGSKPVVPHGDLLNRWKNRRVEFILIKN